MTKYLQIEVTDEIARCVGDVVIIGGVAHTKAEINGDIREVKNRFTIVWASDSEGGWRVVNWQSTAVRTP